MDLLQPSCLLSENRAKSERILSDLSGAGSRINFLGEPLSPHPSSVSASSIKLLGTAARAEVLNPPRSAIPAPSRSLPRLTLAAVATAPEWPTRRLPTGIWPKQPGIASLPVPAGTPLTTSPSSAAPGRSRSPLYGGLL